MPACDECGKRTTMPYECKLCGYQFCSEHRLPENHSCEGLDEYKQGLREEGRMFREKEPLQTGPEGGIGSRVRAALPFSLRGNVALALLAAIVLVYILQILTFALSRGVHDYLFVLGPGAGFPRGTMSAALSAVASKPWTVVTSMFAHDPVNPMHIFINGLVLFFFGPTLEKLIGSRSFAELYFVAGISAGLGFVLVTGASVLGASGAIFGVMGALTMLRPNMRVYVNFLIPMPLWVLTIFYALISIAMIPASGSTGVADLAHLIGLFVGLAWGYRSKGEVSARGPGPGTGGVGGGRRRFP